MVTSVLTCSQVAFIYSSCNIMLPSSLSTSALWCWRS